MADIVKQPRLYEPVWNYLKQHKTCVLKYKGGANEVRLLKKAIVKEKHLDSSEQAKESRIVTIVDREKSTITFKLKVKLTVVGLT